MPKMIRFRRRAIQLDVENFGPIKSAKVEFGNLTVLVGPQASGKSIYLQLLKLLVDASRVKYEFRHTGVAIAVVMLMVFELMVRGYRVCISTHSPQVLDAIWALRHLDEAKADPRALLNVFDAPATASLLGIAEMAMRCRTKVYYFDRDGVTRDISSLDMSAEEEGKAGWGGISEFSGRANEEVARAVANAGRES